MKINGYSYSSGATPLPTATKATETLCGEFCSAEPLCLTATHNTDSNLCSLFSDVDGDSGANYAL